jgi:hypothetical protein
MSRLVNMDRRSRLNFRKAVRLSVFHSAEVNVGHSYLGGKVRVFGILDVYTAMPWRCLSPLGVEKKKRSSRTLSANWENSVDAGRTTLGAALDAGGRSGPRWTSDA